MMCTVLALALTVAAPGTKEAKKDAPGLVGEWAAEAATVGGKAENPPPGTTWSFTADGKSVRKIGDGLKTAEGTYKADAKKDPAQVDISEGPKGSPMTGIYKVDGDTLTLCLAQDGEERPTAFESPAGSK